MIDPDTSRVLHLRFAQQSRRTPERVALREGDRTLSFGELDRYSSLVASGLQGRGLQPGAVIGLHLERCMEWVIGVLGILKAGGTVVPLPPSYPRERLREILDFAMLDAVIEDERWPLDRSFEVNVLDLRELQRDGTGPRAAASVSATQPAFVLCSSGSTGRPKMIARSHRSFFHRLEWTLARHPFGDDDVGCHKAPTTTTHGIYELFEPLLGGAPAIVVPDEESRDLERFWRLLAERRVTRLLIVPSALQASLDMPGFAPPNLKVLVLMGEYVPRRLADRAVERFPRGTALYSIYGSTESSSALVCDLRDPRQPGTELPLGRPIAPEVTARVLGPDLRDVAAGEIGRLYVAGPLLFSGYFKDPELTSNAVVRVPGSDSRLYDTRDDVRVTSSGEIEYLGRADDTVKVRGFRVDLQEVEKTLLQHPQVRQATVFVDSSAGPGAPLVAFYVPAVVDRQVLFEHLREHLPAYMIPSALVGLDSFPLTERGKVDRAILLQQYRHPSAPAPARALSDTEQWIASAWKAVLGHDRFSIDHSYFEIGGSSLSAFALTHRIRDAFSLTKERFTEQDVYRFPTVGEMAAQVDKLLGGRVDGVVDKPPIVITLKKGTDPSREPLFLIASAGGTLGAYEKLVAALQTTREVLGIRDPYLWGERDAGEDFSSWVGRYLTAMRERQPHGPYHIVAYSSAGAFGYEIACRLRQNGEEVALLALIDPLALDRGSRWRYGWWALRATYAPPWLRELVRTAGYIRKPFASAAGDRQSSLEESEITRAGHLRRTADSARFDTGLLLTLATLFELGTGLPLAMDESELKDVPPESRLATLVSRATTVLPDIGPELIPRVVSQYPLQVAAQHAYRLKHYDGLALVVEPASSYSGLIKTLLRPYVPRLRAIEIPMGPPSTRVATITRRFGPIAAHYRCMRDDSFIRQLADVLTGANC